MKALILDGSLEKTAISQTTSQVLQAELHRRGWEMETIVLAEQKIATCMGDFFCWIRSPGACAIDDANRAIARSIANSDLMVFLTPVTFGGYSSELKKAVDHLIQNISPFFTVRQGEVHHQSRYEHYPRFVAIGWLPQAEADSETTFHYLATRNAINMYAPAYASGVVYETQAEAEILPRLRQWLDQASGDREPESLPRPDLAAQPFTVKRPLRRALLLVGSPRGKESTSNSLGAYLMAQLVEQGVEIETIRIYTVLKSPAQLEALCAAVDRADLVALAFPLYVDSLPAPVIHILEQIAQRRRDVGVSRGQRFLAIANCGFPEAAHNLAALSICRNFTRQAGFEWAGGLALGGGEGLVHGAALESLGGRAYSITHALDLAAAALLGDQPVPAEAAETMTRSVIPAWLYRMFGGYGWKQQAKKYQADKRLRAKPYAG